MRIGFNFTAGSRIRGTVTQGAKSSAIAVDSWGTASTSLVAYAGRMNRFPVAVPGGIQQPNGDYTLNLLAEKDARTISFTDANGAAASIAVEARAQRDGWGEGDYYMLETDANGWLVVEPGRNHRKVYVTKGAHGYTKAKIAAQAGVAEATVTNAWLEGRPEYGTQAKPFDEVVGVQFWNSIVAASRGANSHWLLFERGYTYDPPFAFPDGTRGESPLHPIVIGAWGTGAAPTGDIAMGSNGITWANVVIMDIDDGGISPRSGAFLLASNIKTNRFSPIDGNAGGDDKGVDYATQHRCWVHDWAREAPGNGTNWLASPDRHSGSFHSGYHGLLFLETGYNHCGWADGYHPDGLWNNGQYGQPPSMYSHNAYIQDSCRDVDIDAGWTLSPASIGWMMRPGGRVRNTVMADAGVAMNDLGGNYKGAGPVGNFTLILGNVATEAAYHAGVDSIGALNWGIDAASKKVSLVDNVVMHQADPDDPAALALKTRLDWPLKAGSPLFDNTLIFKFGKDVASTPTTRGENIGSLSRTALMLITLQRFAKQEMASPTNVSVRQFGAWLNTKTAKERTELLWKFHDYVRAAYGTEFDDLPPVRRTTAATLHFSPDPRGEGFRADTELNWSTKDLPRNGDSIRQHRNRIKWAKYTRTIADWTSETGLLQVTSGKLTIQALNDEIRTSVGVSGQLVVPAGTGLHYASGGRLSFTGAHSGWLSVNGDAEVLLGPNFTVSAGRTLRIDGGQCLVGWTGTGSATLTLQGLLNIRSTPIVRASGMLYRYRRGTLLKGETSGFTGILDRQEKTSGSAGGWVTAIRDLVGTPVVGENMISPDANGVYPFPTGIDMIPTVHSIGAATLPKIGKFKSNGDHAAPTVNVTVALGGLLVLDLTGVAAGTYTLIEANSITGDFTGQTITGVGTGLTATVNKTATKVEVVVA